MTLRLTMVLIVGATLSAHAGVSDTPLPTFADAQPGQLVATFQAAKETGLDTDVICTNLGPGTADVGVELFDAAGILANTIAAGNGVVLAVGVGHTVTIGSGGTVALHEDVLITLEAPVVNLRQGSGRIVSTSTNLGCVALAVDRLHLVQDPTVCPTCAPPALVLLPFDPPPATTTTTTSSTLGPTTTTTAPTTTTSITLPTSTSTSSTSSTTSIVSPSSTSTTTSALVTTTTTTTTSSSTLGPTTTTTAPTTTTSTTLTTSTSTSSTSTTTLASCASTHDLDAIVCACDRDLPAACPASLLSHRLTVRIGRACTLARRAAASDDARRQQRLTRRTITRLAALARGATRGRRPAPDMCASALSDAAARAAFSPAATGAE